MRRAKWGLCILYNIIRISLLKVFSRYSLKGSVIQIISPGTSVDIGNKGTLIFSGRIHTEKNTLISVRRGVLELGDMYLNRNSIIACREKIIIHNGVTIGPNTVIYDHDHDLTKRGELITSPVRIDKNVWIGANVVILKGVHIGAESVIAAGSVVNADVPMKSIVGGVPAKVIKRLE